MADIWLLDDSLRVSIYYDCVDCDFPDNICISFREVSKPGEKVFKADETNLYLTGDQAQALALALTNAVQQSQGAGVEDPTP